MNPQGMPPECPSCGQIACEWRRKGYVHTRCETCGDRTMMTATKRCDGCHEVEVRLEGYLRMGGDKAKRFVLEALKEIGAANPATLKQKVLILTQVLLRTERDALQALTKDLLTNGSDGDDGIYSDELAEKIVESALEVLDWRSKFGEHT
jgi:hypothetical protein